MVDKTSVLQILGCLMKHPQYLSESDKYNLTLTDFYYSIDKYLFVAIENLYKNGAKRIQPIDVENYIETNIAARAAFNEKNGIEYLQDAIFLSEEDNFQYYYNRLKKINLLNSYKKRGVDIKQFYIEDLMDEKASEINANFESLTIPGIISAMKKKIFEVEKDFIQNDVTETRSIFEGIEEILEDAENKTDVGFPIQGDIFNEVIAGARLKTLLIRSASSGLGKTRQAVGDACYIAFPFRYDNQKEEWVQEGGCQKTLFIATEQDFKDIQKMCLAYLTGFNETKFRYGDFSNKEKKILRQALWIMEKFKDNLHVVRMPNPTIELVKSIIRENVLMKEVEYIFYDYIFIGPSLLNEFRGFNLRNDEILLMFATALKDMAVEQNVFIMTSTQVNASADDNKNIRNESSLAGGRSTINKADTGAIMARPTKEEIDTLKMVIESIGIVPNVVTDIFKVRSGEWTEVRIWSDVNLGNLRKRDLFITDSRLNVIEDFNQSYKYETNWEEEEENELLEVLTQLKEVA